MPSFKRLEEFNQLILESIDEGLSTLGGDTVKRAFYYHLEKRANIKRSEIPDKLEAFHGALAKLFFDGSVTLERRILRHLYERLGLEFPTNNGWTITDYVREAYARCGSS